MGVPVSAMLRFLGVRHLAVIDQLEVEFEPGLNVLTGRNRRRQVRPRRSHRPARRRPRQRRPRPHRRRHRDHPGRSSNAPDGREVIVRREISAQGRSRAFIDDALATTAALRELGDALVDLHGQHEHQTLLDPAEHLELLDAFLASRDLVGRRRGARSTRWRAAAARARSHAPRRSREARAHRDGVVSARRRSTRSRRPTGEDERLAAERAVLANADRLSRLSTEAYAALYDGEHAALATLAARLEARRRSRRARSALRAVPRAARDACKSQPRRPRVLSPRRTPRTSTRRPSGCRRSRIAWRALERLKRKHGPTLADVLAARATLAARTGRARRERRARRPRSSERRARGARGVSRGRAARCRVGAAGRDRRSRARSSARSPSWRCRKSRVDVRVTPLEAAGRTGRAAGIDAVEFFLSPNPGEEPRPLARIASGGELSRVMLALRTLVDARRRAGRTLVFDEVDAGIGGAAADAVGARLQALGRAATRCSASRTCRRSPRAPTPTSSIAKDVRAGRTVTSWSRDSTTPAASSEIARMIAGAEVSARSAGVGARAARQSAKANIKAKAKARPTQPRRKRKAHAWRVSTSSRRSAVR